MYLVSDSWTSYVHVHCIFNYTAGLWQPITCLGLGVPHMVNYPISSILVLSTDKQLLYIQVVHLIKPCSKADVCKVLLL